VSDLPFRQAFPGGIAWTEIEQVQQEEQEDEISQKKRRAARPQSRSAWSLQTPIPHCRGGRSQPGRRQDTQRGEPRSREAGQARAEVVTRRVSVAKVRVLSCAALVSLNLLPAPAARSSCILPSTPTARERAASECQRLIALHLDIRESRLLVVESDGQPSGTGTAGIPPSSSAPDPRLHACVVCAGLCDLSTASLPTRNHSRGSLAEMRSAGERR
jgi:hypothetical protein